MLQVITTRGFFKCWNSSRENSTGCEKYETTKKLRNVRNLVMFQSKNNRALGPLRFMTIHQFI